MNVSPAKADSVTQSLTPEIVGALAGLHDLQLAAPGAWSPWLLIVAGSLFSVVALLALTWWRRPARRLLRRLRLIELAYRKAGDGSPGASARQLVEGVSNLLRDAAIRSHNAPRMPAGLAGDDWLRWLDVHAPPADRGAFLGVVGQCLLEWPFVRPAASVRPDDFGAERADELLALAARWLRANA